MEADMQKFVVLRLEGESNSYLVDLAGGTVTAVAQSDIGPKAYAQSPFRGVELAVVASVRTEVPSQKMYSTD
jgi:hypothetical protein